MSAPLVFDVWADDRPPDLHPAPVTTPPGVRGVQVARIALALVLGAAAGVGTLTVVDAATSAPTRAVDPDERWPQRTGWGDVCRPGAPRC
ncbi:hypothetical protein ACQFYA_06140 [Promicromonospora sp. Marseille-Q5078]